MKMNKHRIAFRNLMQVLLPCLYLTVVPAGIVKYGIANNVPAFANGAPFHEVYSVFCLAWLFGHLLTGGYLYALYMLCYGCQKQNTERGE